MVFGRRQSSESPASAAVKEAPEEALEADQLWQPAETKARQSVEQLLLERGQINADQLLQAQQIAGQTPGRTIAQILVSMSAANEAQVLSAQAEVLGLEFETPQAQDIEQSAFDLFGPDYIRRRLVLPLIRKTA